MLLKKNIWGLCGVMILLFIAVSPGHAQSTRINTDNLHTWIVYNGQHLITDKFGLHAEIQVRRNNGLSNWQQLLLRPGLFYKVNKNVLATAGYCFVETYPYGDIPSAKTAFPEHRIWEQVQLTQQTGSVDITNRFRLEQRFIGDASAGTFTNVRYENRARYMFKANIPLGKASPFYLPVYDEIFIAFGKNVKYNTFDQNRLGLGLGYNVGKKTKLEVGYMYQYVQQRNLTAAFSQVVENNHTIAINVFSSLPFKRGG
ncbi:DUF2490 domain-containing protein [Mucilaginibacter sp. HMF5004]|uniref:DUF2490 domain-containing protein n=1 Tax=Mucilaginibacter rivuli TaxID=2857527 RepID=UPI001C6022E4|nr:DUF2490 domain-containing protein [Mucilaginibacter rivuli]MBW4888848.1 DUF2490 domain-containing protein [Mucilaginibacter rivuli]